MQAKANLRSANKRTNGNNTRINQKKRDMLKEIGIDLDDPSVEAESYLAGNNHRGIDFGARCQA